MVGHDGKSAVPLPADVLTAKQIEEYVAAVVATSGKGLDLAARAIGMTGTAMKLLRNRDPGLQARVEAAVEEGAALYRDRLRATAKAMATGENPSERILVVELGAHVPDYEYLRRDRMRFSGRVEHSIVFDPGALELLTDVQKAALEDALVAMGGEIVDGEARELGPGD